MRQFCTLVFTAIMAAGVAHADEIAYWDANANAFDQSGNGHDGTFAASTYTAGVAGRAFDFFNGSFVEIAADAALEPTSEFSIAMWVRTDPVTGLQLLMDSTHGTGQAGWALQLTSGRADLAYGNGSSFPNVSSTSRIDDGGFHHVAAVFDGMNLLMYIDGTLENTVSYTGTPLPSARNFRIGRHATLNRNFTGAIDEVHLYNHAISQSQIDSLVSVPEPGSVLVGIAFMGMFCVSRRRR